MISPQGISKKTPGNRSLDFKQLREEGMKLIQALSGSIWTDYNLHDPGVTTLEILCYALTELGYRTELLKEAFEAEEPVEPDFINSYFFSHDELLPHLPLTKWDFEDFIEKNHSKVLSAWFEQYPLLHSAGTIRGGFEIALLLESDDQFGNLNTDVIHAPLEQSDAILEVIFFDEENRRVKWGDIREVESCHWNENDPDNFFVFENFNCQVALTLEVVYQNQRRSTTIHTKARVTFNPLKESRRKSQTVGRHSAERHSVEPHQKAIIQKLESPEFRKIITQTLSKEHYKAQLLTDIQQTLLPCRNLCEDFISLRVVNEQEIKIDAEIILNDYAPVADLMINAVYDRIDAFLLQMMRQAKQPEHRSQKNILYASNLIEEMVKIEEVEAARILNLNLFVDGVPTIPLKDETSFECIHLQRFYHYVPKISREKSSIIFIRSGAREKAETAAISKEFKPQLHFFTGERPTGTAKTERAKPNILDKSFFESLREYYSIQNDFPQNYRLREGQLSDKAPEMLKVRVRQFKAYLTFFERILINYLDKLYSLHELLSVKQRPEISENELERLKKQLPDLDLLKLINENKYESTAASPQGHHDKLIQKHKILDHLLARFATSYTPVMTELSDSKTLEKALQAKIMLLKDIPIVTRKKGLGFPVKPQEKEVWDSNLLSGFQKRLYRLLGVKNDDFKHFQLSRVRGREPVGFYLVEHILLIEREEKNLFSKKFNRAAELLYDYISHLSAEDQPHDPYSFQMTIILPDWYPSWRKRRNTVENAIKKEIPAHILPYFHWLNKKNMGEFEILYEDWLKALLQLYKS